LAAQQIAGCDLAVTREAGATLAAVVTSCDCDGDQCPNVLQAGYDPKEQGLFEYCEG
jgi:hypothetical protein